MQLRKHERREETAARDYLLPEHRGRILHRMMGLWRGDWRNIEGTRHQAEAKKVIDAGMLHYRDDELVC